MPRQPKQPKRHYEKPLSLYGYTFDQIVERVVKYKPTKPKKKSRKEGKKPTLKIVG